MAIPTQIGSSINRSVIQLTRSDKPLEAEAQQRADERSQVDSGLGIMTGAMLKQKMGAPPLHDIKIFGMTVKTNSAAYKEALGHLETYQTMLKEYRAMDQDSLEGMRDSLNAQLGKVIDACDAYIAKHEGDDSKTGRRAVMTELKAMAERERDGLEKMTTQEFDVPEYMMLSEVVDLNRAGLVDPSLYFESNPNETLNLDKSTMNIGGGAVSSVHKFVYDTPLGEKTYFAKEVPLRKEMLEPGENSIGIKKENCRFIARNIASETVAELVKTSDHPLLLPSRVTMNDGKPTLVMQDAPGQSPIGSTKTLLPENIQQQNNMAYGALGMDGVLPGHQLIDGQWYNVSSTTLGFPVVSDDKPQLAASIQQQLMDLQALDVLCGQVDRHLGNIHIRIDGNEARVTGIDNDISFGDDHTEIKPRLGNGLNNTNFAGPPPLMSRAMYDKVMDLADHVDDYKQALTASGLTPGEVDAAVIRLNALKDHAETLLADNRIVDDFETWTRVNPDNGQTETASQYLTQSAVEPKSNLVRQLYETDQEARARGHVAAPDPTKHGAL